MDFQLIAMISMLAVIAVSAVYNFIKMGRAQQLNKVKEWLLYAVVEAERELGIKLYKAYKSSDSQGYAASCSISFSANVNGKDMPGSYTTYLVDKDKCKKNK